MASTHPQQPDTVSLNKTPKVLTAGFNSPVPACTLQVTGHPTTSRQPGFVKEQRLAKSGALLQRSWFDRFLEIF